MKKIFCFFAITQTSLRYPSGISPFGLVLNSSYLTLFKRPLKYFLFSGFIFFIFFSTSFCVHQKNNRIVSSTKSVSGWEGPKVVQTPAGDLYVYHTVTNGEPVNVTYVDVKYICKGKSSEDWKRFKVQWFYGVEKPSSGSSVISLVYDPIAELNFLNKDSQGTNDTKKTVTEEFNLETRCLRDLN